MEQDTAKALNQIYRVISIGEQILYSMFKQGGLPSYNPYSDGKYYLATFITANKFYHKDLSAGINALSNLNENVHQLGGNLTYKLNDEVSLGGNLTTFLGEQGALKGTIPRYTLGLSANINF